MNRDGRASYALPILRRHQFRSYSILHTLWTGPDATGFQPTCFTFTTTLPAATPGASATSTTGTTCCCTTIALPATTPGTPYSRATPTRCAPNAACTPTT